MARNLHSKLEVHRAQFHLFLPLFSVMSHRIFCVILRNISLSASKSELKIFGPNQRSLVRTWSGPIISQGEGPSSIIILLSSMKSLLEHDAMKDNPRTRNGLLQIYKATQHLDSYILLTSKQKLPRLVGRFCSYLLPSQALSTFNLMSTEYRNQGLCRPVHVDVL